MKQAKDLAPEKLLVSMMLLSAATFLVVGLFKSQLYQVMDISSYLVFHNVVEFFSVMVSLSIFGLGWYAFDQNRDNHSLFLSVAFLAIGLMDFMHTLGYSGMPALLTPNTPNKATLFWVIVRMFSAVAFLASAFIYSDVAYRWLTKTVLGMLALAVSSLVFVVVVFAPEQLPQTYIEGVGLTPFKKASEYLIIGLLVLASLAYWNRLKAKNDPLLMYYLTAFVLCIFSEMAFTLYKSAFDTYNLLGHLYKVIAFLLIYRGIFVASVRKPYEELRQSRNMFAHIMDSVPQSIFWKDRKSVYLGCNRVFATLAGLSSPEDIVGKTDFELPWSKEETEGYRADDREVIESNRAKYHIIETQHLADGTSTWLDTTKIPLQSASGEVEGVLGVYDDITKRKQAEEDLNESLLFNQQIITCASEGIIVYDRDLHITVWNPFMEEISGLKAASVIGKTPREAFPLHRATGLTDKLEKVLQGEAVPDREFQYEIAETGKSGWASDSFAPFIDVNGEIVGVIRTVRDINENKKTENQLIQAQKMEALGQFAGGVAHDFNNILQVIIGYATLLDSDASEVQKGQIHEIIAASERAAELTKGLLSYSRKQVFKVEPIDINQLLERVEKFLRRILGEDIVFTLEHCADPLVALIDQAHIQQVLVNLVSNARDAMPAGGGLSIRTEMTTFDEEFIRAHGFGTVGPYAHISVSDSGEGIPKDQLLKIFEPFFTTKPEGKGTGLGLAIVYGIIAQHNGHIVCYSEQGIGTTFNIYLPLTDLVTTEERQANGITIPDETRRTILVAEDDQAVRSVTRNVLEAHGYQVIEAVNGKEAIEMFQQHDIDLVILDALMPEYNGAETLAHIRELKPDVKALFVSGYAQEVIGDKMLLPEGVEFINKPVHPARLIEVIKKSIR